MCNPPKKCPFCAVLPSFFGENVACTTEDCPLCEISFTLEEWNTRRTLEGELAETLQEHKRLHAELSDALEYGADSPSLCDLVTDVRKLFVEHFQLQEHLKRFDIFVEVGKEILRQDNRYTDQPMFQVRQRKRVWGFDPNNHDPEKVIWLNAENDYSEADTKETYRLNQLHDDGEDTHPWLRTGYEDYMKVVTTCFTEKGCKAHMEINGHNLKQPEIYAEGSFRNVEYQALRNAMIDIARNTPATRIGSFRHLTDLTAFANEIFQISREDCSADASTIQRLGIKHGLLKESERTSSYGAHCACKDATISFPTTCDLITYTQEVPHGE